MSRLNLSDLHKLMTDRELMQEALLLAKEAANEGEVPVGAVVAKNGRVISKGKNSCESGRCAVFHAEINAIEAASQALGSWRLDGCELFVTLEPCAMCAGAIVSSRISRVIFGAYDERAGALLSKTELSALLDPSLQVIGGYMAQESQKILRDFFEQRRKTKH